MLRAVREFLKGLDRLPDGHVHYHERIVVPRKVRGISLIRLEPPHEAGTGISKPVDGLRLSDKIADPRGPA
jgi:hypothetical protein